MKLQCDGTNEPKRSSLSDFHYNARFHFFGLIYQAHKYPSTIKQLGNSYFLNIRSIFVSGHLSVVCDEHNNISQLGQS